MPDIPDLYTSSNQRMFDTAKEPGITGGLAQGLAPYAQQRANAFGQQLGMQNQQAFNAQPAAGIDPQTGDMMRRRLHAMVAGMDAIQNGADPHEAGYRGAMYMAGHIPTYDAGLPDDHPISRGDDKAKALFGQSDNTAGASDESGINTPTGGLGGVIADAKPITNGELSLMSGPALRNLGVMSPAERAQMMSAKAQSDLTRALTTQMLKGGTAERVEEKREKGREAAAKTGKEARLGAAAITGRSRENAAQINQGGGLLRTQVQGQTARDVATIRANAQKMIKLGASSGDPNLKAAAGELQKRIGADASIRSSGMLTDENKKYLEQNQGEIDRLSKYIQSRRGQTSTYQAAPGAVPGTDNFDWIK